MTAYLVHLGYGLMLCALMARDVLWLRLILMAAQSVLATYALSIGVPAIAAWNTGFVVINGVWVAKILHERRAVTLPPDLHALHELTFHAMSPGEFLRFWSLAETLRVRGALLTAEGEYPGALHLVVDGEALVERAGRHVTRLTRGQFAGEMSLITGRPANATVTMQGDGTVRTWPVSRLRDLRERDAALWERVQSVLGVDLVDKVRRGDVIES